MTPSRRRTATLLAGAALVAATAAVGRWWRHREPAPDAQVEAPDDTSGNTPADGLVRAAAAGDPRRVRELLDAGVSADARDAREYGPLHQAAAHDASAVVALLTERGSEVNAPGGIGWTPLTWAAFHGALDSVRGLIAAGADPNAVFPPNRVAPLSQLVAGWHMALAGAPLAPPLREAGRVEIARSLLNAGADPNFEGGGGLPMHTALFLDNLELIRLLVEAGARLDDLPYARAFLSRNDALGDLLRRAAEDAPARPQ